MRADSHFSRRIEKREIKFHRPAMRFKYKYIHIHIKTYIHLCRLDYSTPMLCVYIYTLEGVIRCVYTTVFQLFTLNATLASMVGEKEPAGSGARGRNKNNISPFIHPRYAILYSAPCWGVALRVKSFGIYFSDDMKK